MKNCFGSDVVSYFLHTLSFILKSLPVTKACIIMYSSLISPRLFSMEVGPVVTKSIVEDVHESIKNTPSLNTDEEKEAFKSIVKQSNGLEVLFQDMTPLFHSVKLGRLDHIEVLIEMKADFTTKCRYESIDQFIAENEENCVKICKVIREAVKKRGADGVRETIVLGKIKTLYEKNKMYDPEEVLLSVSRQIEALSKLGLNAVFEKTKEPNKDYVMFTCRDPVDDVSA